MLPKIVNVGNDYHAEASRSSIPCQKGDMYYVHQLIKTIQKLSKMIKITQEVGLAGNESNDCLR
eukprot:Pgem_evm1s2983